MSTRKRQQIKDDVVVVANSDKQIVEAYTNLLLLNLNNIQVRAVHNGVIAGAAAICKVSKEVFAAAWIAQHATKKSIEIFLNSILPRDAHLLCSNKLVCVYSKNGSVVCTRRWHSRTSLLYTLNRAISIPTTFDKFFGLSKPECTAWTYRTSANVHAYCRYIIDDDNPTAEPLPARCNMESHCLKEILGLGAY